MLAIRPEELKMKEWKGPEDGLPPIRTKLDGVKVFGCDGIREWRCEPTWIVVAHHEDGKRFIVEPLPNRSNMQSFSIEKDGDREYQFRPLRTEDE